VHISKCKINRQRHPGVGEKRDSKLADQMATEVGGALQVSPTLRGGRISSGDATAIAFSGGQRQLGAVDFECSLRTPPVREVHASRNGGGL